MCRSFTYTSVGLLSIHFVDYPDSFGIFNGCASAIGERPYYQFSQNTHTMENNHIKTMVYKTLEEMLFNLVWVGIRDFNNIRVSANWMGRIQPKIHIRRD